ncbi:MAG: ribonuclease R [Candidatus Dactylopiibacterium carminicum]|uniref:Ribonuclease R n=1 Tax=Candidatus Dactylopiibacterium carminicum TaxID=857335 RepID=A0A272EZ34_9RHOO|nr:ribonuclease R [Candidatus Dactylopiibacterium carminicum]KAF7600883.1 ribonuclease R [Candidatus Dactylopiibacterium carminicum]PAS95382.1 MAG: ribonuclease R [Candidatus Dactylopiibacterium carminicum]PAS98607.1 MAG: ribonuclease R [Candidatus Dactylopiibacterium carminicum]
MKTNKKPRLARIRAADPFYAREAERYEFPLPSREYIQQLLGDARAPMPVEALAELLAIRADEQEAFTRRLGAMERAGQLMRNRRGAYILPDKADLIRGRVEGHPDGFGFLVPDDGGEDLFLGPRAMREVLHGDRVLVRVIGADQRGRREAKIIEVLERANERVVGRVAVEAGVAYVIAENRRISQGILLAPGGKQKPRAGQVVSVDLLQQPSQYSQPIGQIVETLGNYADDGMEIEIALRKHDLPFEFSDEVKAEAKKLPAAVRKKDWQWEGGAREDIRHLPLVTIDGETAKDFDDAVYCEKQGRGYRLLVAIADVSHYVTPGSALDVEGLARGNSVYFPRRVIPMLPEKLSNGLCSLNPEVERLCMVCDMSINASGVIKAYRFYPAVMFSHARLTYTKVAAMLYGDEAGQRDEALRAEHAPLLPHLETLDVLFRILLKARAKRGAIEFETVETKMIFDEQGKIERIVPESRNDAHRLIEECMLAANVCASEYLQKNKHPALFRVHEAPTPEKLGKLREFLAEFGLGLGGGDSPRAADFAKVVDKIKDRPDARLIQTVMLRTMQQAVYSPENVGHFGLAFDAYTHFTSPIRRYPDLLVHRAIKAVLRGVKYQPSTGPVELLRDTRRKKGGKPTPEAFARAERETARKRALAEKNDIWEDIGVHCSQTERRADEASRDVETWLKCFYMQDRIGEQYAGSVTAVTSFGIFVTLDELFVEGLVHISDLGADYFHYDEARHALVGERTGQQFRLSDRVEVEVVRVDLESRKIDFRLIDAAMPATRRTGKTARDRQRDAETGEAPGWRELAGLPAGSSPRKALDDLASRPGATRASKTRSSQPAAPDDKKKGSRRG